MKKIFFSLLWVLGAQVVLAQTEKNVILSCADCGLVYNAPEPQQKDAGKTVSKVIGAVLEAAAGSAYQTEQHSEYLGALHDAVAGGIGAARRVAVKDGDWQPGTVANSGCDIYFDGRISSISTTRRVHVWEDKNKKNHEDVEFKGSITGTVNLKDAATGEILTTYTINNSAYSESWLSTADKALGYCIEGIKSWLTRSINNAYPLYASIVEGSTAKKDKQKEVYIDLGEKDLVYKGLKFNVYLKGQVAGKETRRVIGRLRIEEVQGDDISLCKVSKGGVEIKDALEAGETLLITSYE